MALHEDDLDGIKLAISESWDAILRMRAAASDSNTSIASSRAVIAESLALIRMLDRMAAS